MSEQLDWGKLPFDFNGIKGYVVSCYGGNMLWTTLGTVEGTYISVHIAAGVLHYALEIFEGMRCFRTKDGRLLLFRPTENAKRFRQSAELMIMPVVPEELYLQAILRALEISQPLQPPHGSGASMYIRPFEFGSGPQLGVRKSDEYTFAVYATPVGPYFKTGFNQAISCFLTEFDRVPPNGMGNAKAGANYGATIVAIEQAKVMGCQAPLFTQPGGHKVITETHASNVAFVIDGNVVTLAQNSYILESVTRRSLVELCHDMDIPVEERDVEVSELIHVTEAFGMGTGATLAPIGRFRNKDGWLRTAIKDPDKPGELTTQLYHHLTSIQQGDLEDIHDWNVEVTF